ncbi:hypothetical protein E4U24_007691 [Claviceps purpurea]|nr:hypothetical protein E4U24_007691 [Claviceps purpurea]
MFFEKWIGHTTTANNVHISTIDNTTNSSNFRGATEVERLRAKDVAKATIARESKQQAAADAAAYYEVAADARARQEANHRMADADVYKTRIDAEADNYAAQKRAEAYAVSQIKEAEGIAAMADAYAKMATASYMMIEKSTYIELAKANAEAICCLQPKISVWNTGGGGGSGGNETGGES